MNIHIWICGIVMTALTVWPDKSLFSDPVDVASKPAVQQEHARNTLIV